jgi:carboxyl-terminal processing protease
MLLAVDELFITPELTNDVIEAALRGPVGQGVNIVISRAAAQELAFEIRREEVALPSVIYHPVENEPRVGLIQVRIIADTTAEEIVRAVESLRRDGVSHFILDLRENGGGLLNAGIETARLFLREGVVIEEQYQGKAVEKFEVTEEGRLAEIPLIVLVNQHTASAAEIVAGALQANGRALLMGTPTYGKDTIQQVFELRDGSSLHITSAHWWFPGLAFPGEGGGLSPDVAGAEEANWIEGAVDILLQTP